MDCWHRAALFGLVIAGQLSPGLSDALAAELPPASSATDEAVLKQCHDLTKRILLAEIELERFSLNYRLASMKSPRLVLAQYAGNHEAGIAGGFASAVISTQQAAIGRGNPAQVDDAALRSGLQTSFVTTILSGSSSAVSLASSVVIACRNHRSGLSSAQANRFVQSHLSKIDQMLDERETLVAANSEHPLAPMAVQEGKILRLLRNGCLLEYAKFNRNIRNYRTGRNSFYALNVATNVVKATALNCSVRALSVPHFQGPASILTVLTGAMTFASPLVSTVAGSSAGRLTWHALSRQTGGIPDYSYETLVAEEQRLSQYLKELDPGNSQLNAALTRSQLYGTSSQHIRDELHNEARALGVLTKVVDQSNIFGPALGSMAMSQGILSTLSYYKFGASPRRQVNLNYTGSVVGLAGNSIGLGVNSATLVLAVAYIRHLQKTHRMPAELVEYQLERLDQVEQKVRSL